MDIHIKKTKVLSSSLHITSNLWEQMVTNIYRAIDLGVTYMLLSINHGEMNYADISIVCRYSDTFIKGLTELLCGREIKFIINFIFGNGILPKTPFRMTLVE